jgi:hypothetical protein
MGILTKTLIKVLPSKYSKRLEEYKIEKETSAWYKSQLVLQKQWKNNRNFVPPPHIAKQEMILKYAHRFNISVFVETGTYLAFMIDAMKDNFGELYSIELSQMLYERAVRKFVDFPHIHFLHGDSGIMIPAFLKKLNQPCLFWLDGHYSGGVTAKTDIDTPIIAELKAILEHHVKSHVILIDDARLFDGTKDYPTIANLQIFLQKYSSKFFFEIEQDIIVIFRNPA